MQFPISGIFKLRKMSQNLCEELFVQGLALNFEASNMHFTKQMLWCAEHALNYLLYLYGICHKFTNITFFIVDLISLKMQPELTT